MMPAWLHDLSLAYLVLGGLCAALVGADLARHPQRMWIMDLVWPLAALFGTFWIVWQYFTYGRRAARGKSGRAGRTPFWAVVANGALHCGAGCTLGDICAEWLVFALPSIAHAFGWHSLFAQRMFAVWIVDFLFAYGFGIFFQYFAIAPMRHLPPGRGLVAAVKADTLSLAAWQLGMYGFMAVASFRVFRRGLGAGLETDSVEFWFMMQMAMICGFATAYPVNWWLVKSGLKEPM